MTPGGARSDDPVRDGREAAENEALAAARARAEAAPDRPSPWFALCRLLLKRGDPEAARLLPVLERFPRHAPGWCDLGATLLAAGKPGAALLAFERANDTAPELLPALLGRSTALLALDRAEEAVPVSATAERLDRHGASAAFRHGLALRAARRESEAEDAFERAVGRDPRHGEGWFALGSLRGDRGDHAGAVEAFRAALRARPDLHEAAFNLGVALTETHALDGALDAFALAWRLRPRSLGRIAQALVSAPCGCLFLDPADLERDLAGRA